MDDAPWHESDAFWEHVEDAIFRERILGTAPAQVDGLLALTGVPPGADVLDLPCGVGRHSVELARRGFRVTGVDRTERYLQRARRAAETEGLEAEWVCADMREFRRPAAFDLALNLFTSFGYFEDSADDERVARGFLESLRSGGVLVMDLAGKEWLARVWRDSDWSRGDKGELWLQERRLRDGWDWVDNTWIFIDGATRREVTLGHRLYSGAELKRLLLDVGFDTVSLFGSFEGGPYDQTASRLVAVARK